jgi:hypothetical protein
MRVILRRLAFGVPLVLVVGAGFVYTPPSLLYRDAANTLAQRNGGTVVVPVPQSHYVYNFCDGVNCATGYERAGLAWSAGAFAVVTEAAGTGAGKPIYLAPGGAVPIVYSLGLHVPYPNDAMTLGIAGGAWKHAHLTRSVSGGMLKDLTEGVATSILEISVPQTAGANYADAMIHWSVYASDGTNNQVRRTVSLLAARNQAGTETCVTADLGTLSDPAATVTCTSSCITGLTDAVRFALNCTSSLTQTTLRASGRVDQLQPNSVSPLS